MSAPRDRSASQLSGPDSETAPILVVDDDAKILTLVRTYLEREGFAVVTASDGKAALSAFRGQPPALVVLDLMLPGLDGLAVMRIVREDSEVPILIVSARGSEANRVHGIREGADDYLPKPFSPAELVVRVKAILRRTSSAPVRPADRGCLKLADLTIDLDRHEVSRSGQRIPVTAAEFRLLTALVQADGRVLSRELLLDALSGQPMGEALDRTIDVHLLRLRRKLGDDAGRPRYLATVRGTGYRTVKAEGA